jgi:hypothetical protein
MTVQSLVGFGYLPISELIKSSEYITDYVMLMDLLESNFTINGDNHKK